MWYPLELRQFKVVLGGNDIEMTLKQSPEGPREHVGTQLSYRDKCEREDPKISKQNSIPAQNEKAHTFLKVTSTGLCY